MLNRLLHNIPGLRLGVYDAATYMTRDEAVGAENRGKPLTKEQEKAIIEKAGGASWHFYAAAYGAPNSLYSFSSRLTDILTSRRPSRDGEEPL